MEPFCSYNRGRPSNADPVDLVVLRSVISKSSLANMVVSKCTAIASHCAQCAVAMFLLLWVVTYITLVLGVVSPDHSSVFLLLNDSFCC